MSRETEILYDRITRLEKMVQEQSDRIYKQDDRINHLEKELLFGKGPTSRRAERKTDEEKQKEEQATERVMEKLEERRVDTRCIDFWRSNPECHLELLRFVEDEEKPPGREPGRDESPYWMATLKKHLDIKHGIPPKGKGKKGKRASSRSRSRSRRRY